MSGSEIRGFKSAAAIAAATVVGIWLLSWGLLGHFFAGRWEHAGTFGDSFGAVNALFSGLALAGLVYAILLQQQELTDTREELKGQREALDLQNFENTFFQLLKLQADIVNAIDLILEDGQQRKGRDCFKTFHWQLQRAHKKRVIAADEREAAVQAYMQVYRTYEGDLGHYFRSFYHIIKFVHESPGVRDKRRYTNFARAQLSSFELVLLFYNGLSPLGSAKMKPLIEEYALLKNLSAKRLLSPRHTHYYEASAFKGSKSEILDDASPEETASEDEGLTT